MADLIKTIITADATKTEPGYCTAFITKLVDAVPFTYSRHNSNITYKFRTLNNFKKLLSYSCDHPDLYAYIELDIDDLYFIYNFLPRDLDQVSFDNEFSPGPETSAGPPQRGGSRAPAPVPQSPMVHFNLTTLPTDVLTRVQKHRSDELMNTK